MFMLYIYIYMGGMGMCCTASFQESDYKKSFNLFSSLSVFLRGFVAYLITGDN